MADDIAHGVNPETAGAAPPQTAPESPPEAAPSAPEEKPAEEHGPVPYDRFNEVLTEKNAAREELERIKSSQDELIQREAEARTQNYLAWMAQNNPELRSVLYGEAPTEKPPEKDAEGNELSPEQQRMMRIEAEQKDLRARVELAEQDSYFDEVGRNIDTEMRRHPLFENQQISEMAEKVILRELELKPNADVASVVQQMADNTKAVLDSYAENYEKGKADARAALPPSPVAGSGGLPAGAPPPKPIKISEGEGATLLQKAIEQGGGLKL